MPAKDMAAYMRARRARQRAETNSVAPSPKVQPTPKLVAQAERARVAAQRDYEAPGGRGATSAQVIAAGERAAARVVAQASPGRSRELAVTRSPLHGKVIPPQRSMRACGGEPARPYPRDASRAEATAMIRAMWEATRREKADTDRQLAELRQDVAELKEAKALRRLPSPMNPRGKSS